MVLTIGPAHDRPWWWQQLARSPLRAQLVYERMTLGGKSQRQLSLRDLPGLLWRFAKLLRDARRAGITHILTFESDISCYLIGLLQSLPLQSGPQHVILQFISREKPAGWRGELRDLLARACLRSVRMLVCSSRREAQYYRERFGWPERKVVFVPFHSDQEFLDRRAEPEEDYIIAAGRSYRDYATLATAVSGTGIRTLIVCGRGGTGVTTLPQEIEQVVEIPLAQLINLMAKARVVVLPLEDRRISTGQTVLLQAMALGRPVIATRTAGTEDYIEANVSGILVPPRDAAALRAAIELLWNDAGSRSAIGRAARRQIARHNLPLHYAHGVARALAVPAGLSTSS
jgi:glycosyltransferase involved in cell wall biosynthesis